MLINRGLSPQARVDSFGRGSFVDEAVLLRIPDRVSRVSPDYFGWQRGYETSFRGLEIRIVSKRQLSQQGRVCLLGRIRCVLARVLVLRSGGVNQACG